MANLTGHGVNDEDEFKVAAGPCIYVEGPYMSKRETRHGFWFAGPDEIKIKKLRELAAIAFRCAMVLEKGLAQEKAALTGVSEEEVKLARAALGEGEK